MAIEIVSFPIKNGGSFHSFLYVYQRVMTAPNLLGGKWDWKFSVALSLQVFCRVFWEGDSESNIDWAPDMLSCGV